MDLGYQVIREWPFAMLKPPPKFGGSRGLTSANNGKQTHGCPFVTSRNFYRLSLPSHGRFAFIRRRISIQNGLGLSIAKLLLLLESAPRFSLARILRDSGKLRRELSVGRRPSRYVPQSGSFLPTEQPNHKYYGVGVELFALFDVLLTISQERQLRHREPLWTPTEVR